ncbi:MAG: SDR family oxidoreductase [Bacteroidales bacterium]|nr:SDR family oxidoreductase [Bacteroidales bacterium]
MKTDNQFDISGRVAVMTGACGVLGQTIVKYFAAQGCKVVLLDLERAAQKGWEISKEIESEGGEAIFLPTDVLDENVLEANLETILDRYGRVDILLNAAGGNMDKANVRPDQSMADLDIEAMKKVCELNIFGTVIPTKVFSKPMIETRKGSIINFCSMTSLRPLTRVAGYGIAKAGIASWTEWLAGELATKYGDGLRVNAIAPGFLLTNQNRTLLTNPDGSLTDRSHKIIAHTPFGRFLQPDELTGTLHYLASDASRGVTGTISVVDGGFNAFSI